MNKFIKKISTNLKQLKVEPDATWLAQTRQDLVEHISAVNIEPKRTPIFNNYSEVFKLLLQPMPVALASFGLILIFGSAAISNSQSTLPGDTLYSLKRASEQIVLSLVSNPQIQANLKVSYENRRLDELLRLYKKTNPATINNYNTNSVITVTHIDNDSQDQGAVPLETSPPTKLSLLTTDLNDHDLMNNQLKINNQDFPETKIPSLTPTPTINDDIDTSEALAEILDQEKLIYDEPSSPPVEQPRYAYLGGSGGNASVKTPAPQPTIPKTSEDNITIEKSPTNFLSNNIESQSPEQNIDLDNAFSMPISESQLFSEDTTNATPATETTVSTSTDLLVENDNTSETTVEIEPEPTSDDDSPVQDQPTEDPQPGDASDDPNGDEEPDMPDDGSETNESAGVIINIESNYPR